MQLSCKTFGDVVMLVGTSLFLVAVVADAPTALVAIPILVLMAGALLTLTVRAR